MDTTYLRYFVAVARAGSLTAAAVELGISQPTLTVAMRKLEAQLQTRLFYRDRNGMIPTETGQELLRHANEVLELLDRAEERVRGLESEERGQIILGCSAGVGTYFLPSLMADFVGHFTSIELELLNVTSAEVTKAVVDRRAHFGLVANPRPHPELVLVRLFDDAHDLFVARKEQPRSVAEAEARLRAGPLVYIDVPQAAALIQELGERGLVPGRKLPCGALHLVYALTAHDVGVGILPRRFAAHGWQNALEPLHPSLPSVTDTIYLAFRADRHKTRAAQLVKEALVAVGRTLASGAD